MRDKKDGWTRIVRASGLVEWICPHGVGHPDPASARAMGESWSIHGCDGCCSREDFPGRAPDGEEEP